MQKETHRSNARLTKKTCGKCHKRNHFTSMYHCEPRSISEISVKESDYYLFLDEIMLGKKHSDIQLYRRDSNQSHYNYSFQAGPYKTSQHNTTKYTAYASPLQTIKVRLKSYS